MVLKWRTLLHKLWASLLGHTDNDRSDIYFPTSDAILRPPFEAGKVNELINELLIHIGLIKVSVNKKNALLGIKSVFL